MGLSVLIVDDSSVMRKIVERSVRQAAKDGVDHVVEAGDGGEAMRKLDRESVQVVFSDINMPNVGGLEFLRRLKESPHAGLPVIIVSTDAGETVVKEAIDLGAKGFIHKPFTPKQMESALEKAFAE